KWKTCAASSDGTDQMNEYTGWLLDVYPDPENGIALWFLCDDGRRRCLYQDLPVTFYAAGPVERLRAFCYFLKRDCPRVKLARDEGQDLFYGLTTVLASTFESPSIQSAIYRRSVDAFPDLTFYDADLDVALRHAAIYGTFSLARCHVAAD